MNYLIFIPSLYITVSILYQFILGIASLFDFRKINSLNGRHAFKKILIVVPAYREDSVILNSCRENFKVNYPNHLYDILVIADQMKKETNLALREMGVIVFKVSFKNSTKAKALNAVNEFVKSSDYEGQIILDADNIMSKNFLKRSSKLLCAGYEAVQALRQAKKLNSPASVFDALAEIANHKMLCQGANVIGLSSKLSGSGMLLSKVKFLEIIPKLSAIGGFDKEMELLMTKMKIKIYYDGNIHVKDEKCQDFNQMSRQRARWLESQYSFFRKNFVYACKALNEGNFDYFHKVIQLALPPRTLIPIASLILGLISLICGLDTLAIINLTAFLLNLFTYIILTPFNWILKHGANLILALPKLIHSTIKSLSLMPQSKKEFIHTQHFQNDV
ncbi:glycosyltransferase family 2 protein [Hyphobacterium sp. CCMP332]|nr:glycosyltransferase family 2 protein [Hyphobacterium sp. CCMP332]